MIISDLRHDGKLLHITLNAPKANILDAKMLRAISEALAEHGPGGRLRAIFFEGSGRHFCFGASVEEHQHDQVAGMLSQFHGLFKQLGKLALPTFAVVRGQCLGGGLELASYCSWIFAAPDSAFGQPEIKLAVFPPMASVLLPWRVGGAAAVDLCVTGRSIGAEHALRIGLIQDVSDDPAAAADAYFTEHVASLSASSVRFAERAARISLVRSIEQDLPALERLYLEQLMETHDANEGINAFLEKRSPVYE